MIKSGHFSTFFVEKRKIAFMRLENPSFFVRLFRKKCTTPRSAHSRMTYLRNIGAHNAYDVIQDGAEKVHDATNDQRRTTK